MRKILAVKILLALCLAGCWTLENKEFPVAPDIGVDLGILNQDLEITAPSSRNDFKINENITLLVHLKTDIQVSSDFDIQIFTLDKHNEEWVENTKFDPRITTIDLSESENVILNKENRNIAIFVRPANNDQDKEVVLLIMLKAAIINKTQVNGLTASYIVVILYQQ